MTDTFQMNEADGTTLEDMPGFGTNIERVERQKKAPIKVILMNPPYSAGQRSANDNNQNLKYPKLDKRIEQTYVARSTGTNKNSLYDSYFRALRWATDRIGDEGIIAFVSNNSFIDGNTADGVRLTWEEEFSHIYVYNLKGNARSQGERRRQEGGNVFGEGTRTGACVAVLIKTKDQLGPAVIHYAEVADYLTRQEKLDVLSADVSIDGTEESEHPYAIITPNEHGDWLNQRDERFQTYQPIGDKATKGKENTSAIFRMYSRGLETSRDPWVYNFSSNRAFTNTSRMIAEYSHQLECGERNYDSTKISWSSTLESAYKRSLSISVHADHMCMAIYRPFCKQSVYFDQQLNHRRGQLPQIFPTPAQRNVGFVLSQGDLNKIGPLAIDSLPDLHLCGDAQTFALFTWEKVESSGAGELDLSGIFEAATSDYDPNVPLDFTRALSEQIPAQLDGYVRRDNITDATLTEYRRTYADASIGKEDIFFYVYALLHHPEYRERYEADLKKMLPRIPLCEGFWEYAQIGRQLAELHVNYERQEEYPLQEQWALSVPADQWQRYHVERSTWLGRKDHSGIRYNEYLTLLGIPEEANAYVVNGRAPLEWVLDRYRVITEKNSQIVNDPNDYCREIGEPAYIVSLIKRLVTVSLRTQRLIAELPEFQVKG